MGVAAPPVANIVAQNSMDVICPVFGDVIGADIVDDIFNGAVAREEGLIQFCRVIKDDKEVLEN